MKLFPSKYSFRLAQNKDIVRTGKSRSSQTEKPRDEESISDKRRRLFLKALGAIGLGALGVSMFPRKASALVMGGTPATSVVGLKDDSNLRINPATEETLQTAVTGNTILKKTVPLTSSGIIHTPASGKRLRIYNTKFSLSADMNSVAFRFTTGGAGGTNFEYYYSPKTGGLYGSNNHPNYLEGGVDQDFYAVIDGTGTVQVNIDYLEV